MSTPVHLCSHSARIRMGREFEMLAEYLEARGCCRVILAQNGEEALKFVKEKHPDIVLMDIQMPVMDGLEATRRLKADDDVKQIPIIALTGKAF